MGAQPNRASKQTKAWRCLDRPLHWLVCWTQDVIRHGEDIDRASRRCTWPRSSRNALGSFAPSQPSSACGTLTAAVVQDEGNDSLSPAAIEVAFRELLHELVRALEEER